MPSFTKRTPTASKPLPKGTHTSPSSSTPPLHLVRTGIPSLDDILGGGLPLGGVWLLLAPDRHTNWSRVVERYWIASGLVDCQKGLVVGEGGEEVVRGCMWVDARSSTSTSTSTQDLTKEDVGLEPSTTSHAVPPASVARRSTRETRGSESEGEDVGMKHVSALGENRPKIAWRYDGMKRFQTTSSEKSDQGELTLLKTISSQHIADLERHGIQNYIPLTLPASSSSTSSIAWTIMRSVLTRLQALIKTSDETQVLRVTIHNLGDVLWGSPTATEIMRFVHALKGLVRERSVAVMITLPPALARGLPIASNGFRSSDGDGNASAESWVRKLTWSVDACIELKGFGDDPTLPPLFHPLHGLVTPHSLPTTHHLVPPSYKHSSLLGLSTSSSTSSRGGGAGENNLGFRLTRKRLVVETVHLGIEGGTGERRTEPAAEPLGSGSAMGIERSAPLQAKQMGQSDIAPSAMEPEDGSVLAASSAGIPSTAKRRGKGVRFQEESVVAPQATADSQKTNASPARVYAQHDKMDLYDF